jgi:hypothetical protein
MSISFAGPALVSGNVDLYVSEETDALRRLATDHSPAELLR